MEKFTLDVELLERLCNAFGPSGFEREVQKMVKEIGSQYTDEITTDKTGSLIFRYGNSGPKIMLAGHADEVGFIITHIEKNGTLRFHQLGGWWDQVLLGHQVRIRPLSGKPEVIGIIGAKPPHVLTPEERKIVMTKKEMFMDIGCQSAEDVKEMGIEVGDPVVPHAIFRTETRQFITKETKEGAENLKRREIHLAIGKAFDDRIGVFIALEILKYLKINNIQLPNQVFFVATTQEEVGLRGARTAAQMIKPDIGIALEVDIAGDVVTGVPTLRSKLGGGVSIDTFDATMIPNPYFRRFFMNLAAELGIEYALTTMPGGGTDAGVMHLTDDGAPSICLGVPTRHIHAHYGILAIEDIEKVIRLLCEALQRLDQVTVNNFTDF